MDRDLTLKLNIDAAVKNNALQQATADMQRLGKEEQDYLVAVGKRLKAMEQELRIKQDLQKFGIGRELSDEEKYSQKLNARIKAHEEDLRLRKDLQKVGIGRELSDEEKALKIVNQRLDAYKTMKLVKEQLAKIPVEEGGEKRGFGDSLLNKLSGGRVGATDSVFKPGLAGVFSKAGMTAIGGGVVAGVAAANTGAGQFRDHYREGRDASGAYDSTLGWQGFRRRLENAPLVGNLAKAWNDADGLYERDRRARELEMQSSERGNMRAIEGRRYESVSEFERQRVEAEATLKHGPNNMGKDWALRQHHVGDAEKQMGRAGGTAGYTREAEQGDILRRSEHQYRLETSHNEFSRQRAILGDKQQHGANVEVDLRAKRDMMEQQYKGLATSVNQTGAGEDPVAYQAKMIQLQTAKNDLIKAEEQLQQQINRNLDMQKQKTDLVAQANKAKNDLLRGRRDELSGTIQSEEQLKQGRQERLGLMQPHQKQALVALSRKVKEGKDLNAFEVQFAQQHSDLFGDALKKQGARLAGPEFKEIHENLGLDARRKGAEAERAKIDHEIDVNITVDSESLAEQIGKKVLPELAGAINQADALAKQELARERIAQKAAANAANRDAR